MMPAEELFPLVDKEGQVIGRATRRECHSGSFLLHPVVHLHVFNAAGALFLQKRSLDKDIQPGKWDTSVGGHVNYGETVEQALYREAHEELNLTAFQPIFALRYPFRSNQEYELVNTYYTYYEGTLQPDPVELSEGRFWSLSEIHQSIGKGLFTPNFEQEFPQIMNMPPFIDSSL
jgi:isopentenyldiphosphate isomerase